MNCSPRHLRAAFPGIAALAALSVLSLLTACGTSSSGGAASSGPSSTARTSGASSVSQPAAASTPAPPRAAPVAAVNPCARNASGKVVRVGLAAQHLWMCQGTRLVRDTGITSGMTGQYTETPRGHYRVESRNRHTQLTLNTGKTYDVQYWIPFDAPLFGFHDSPWQHFAYGSRQYRTKGSHGCVHMPLKQIAFLYRWAEVGTRVAIT